MEDQRRGNLGPLVAQHAERIVAAADQDEAGEPGGFDEPRHLGLGDAGDRVAQRRRQPEAVHIAAKVPDLGGGVPLDPTQRDELIEHAVDRRPRQAGPVHEIHQRGPRRAAAGDATQKFCPAPQAAAGFAPFA